jgi:hypothetical protein
MYRTSPPDSLPGVKASLQSGKGGAEKGMDARLMDKTSMKGESEYAN